MYLGRPDLTPFTLVFKSICLVITVLTVVTGGRGGDGGRA